MAVPNSNTLGGANTKFTTWNAKGVNHPVKRSKIFAHLSKLKTDIAFLTETHLLNKNHNMLKRGGFSQIFHSKFDAKFRGTAILIHRDVQFVQSKVLSGSDGRYIIVQGHLFNIPVILACVYAPNWDNAKFFSDLFSLLPDMNSHNLILGGDLNTVLCPGLDRSRTTPGTLSKSAETIKAFLQAYGVIDVWRYKHPGSRQYSFFSAAHQSYCRLDYLLMDRRLLPFLKSSECESIVISDHGPVTMTLGFPNNEPPQRIWRLNSRLLSNEEFVAFINSQIDFFTETNKHPDTSHCTFWETMKAYLWDQIIIFNSGLNKSQQN